MRTPADLVKAFHEGELTFLDECKSEPETAWMAIVELSRQSLNDEEISVLAAGSLEDVLAYHGPAFIDRVEKEARTYQAFRYLLSGVWRSSIAEPVWQRVEKIRGLAW